jgi:hypothetical protein
MWRTAVKALSGVLICLFAASLLFAQAESPKPLGIEELYLAKDDGRGNAGEPVDEFTTTDVPIYCVVLLDASAKAVVKMNFVAVRVSGVKPETKVVSTSYTTTARQNRVNFTGRPEREWVPGTYRVDLYVDGRLSKNLEFEIKGRTVPAAASKFVQSPSSRPKPPKGPAKP